MSAVKLKLKRKKDSVVSPDAGSRQQHGGGLSSRRCSSTGSWFDEIELTAAEQMWRQVLKAANTSLTNLEWDVVPRLPECSNKNIQKSREETHEHEVVRIGQEEFHWIPFPNYPTDISIQNGDGNIPDDHTFPNQDKESSLEDIRVVCEKDLKIQQPVDQVKSRLCLDATKQSIPATKKRPSKKAKKPVTAGSQTQTKLFPTKRAEVNKTQDASPDQRAKREPQAQEPEIIDLVTEDTAEEVEPCHSRAPALNPHSSAGVVDLLDNCPICLKEFPKGISQLEIDSHLAQCLSESTVDVMW
uniref:UBZ2-type domain-containing protein n=1 Tax=Leptobrachium leishanense TaxID=445787 RepID=A0A8C5QD59_9ANUR